MFKKKLGFLLGVMVMLSLAGYLVCLLMGSSKQINKDEDFLLVTSFYPMYVLAENLTTEVEGVTVSNLTENQTGCLHDYQLTSRDMKLLNRADAFLVNGAGMELFMEKVMEGRKELPVIEAAHGISLLGGIAHDHGEEAGHNHAHEQNGHVWMDVERYRAQLVTVTTELQSLLPEQAAVLSQAAAAYDEKLAVLSAEAEDLKQHTEGIHVVIFHEAFAYLAESLGMEILMSLSLDEETVPSAGEIAEVIEEINHHGAALVFIEKVHASYADKILAETDANVVYIDPLTIGDGEADSYLSGMWENLSAIRHMVK